MTSTSKLKVQLLTLQNSLMDGKNRSNDVESQASFHSLLELDAWFQACYSKQNQVLPVEVVRTSNINMVKLEHITWQSHRKKTFKQKISALSTEASLKYRKYNFLSYWNLYSYLFWINTKLLCVKDWNSLTLWKAHQPTLHWCYLCTLTTHSSLKSNYPTNMQPW